MNPGNLSTERARRAFTVLGERWHQPLELTLCGGLALLLQGHSQRGTDDVDVIACTPGLPPLAALIAEIGEELGLGRRWLNDEAKTFARFLLPDMIQRRTVLGVFGEVQVFLLGRRDLVLLKALAHRLVDEEDLEAMRLTVDEIQVAQGDVLLFGRVDQRATEGALALLREMQ